jgi:hypothetical protein
MSYPSENRPMTVGDWIVTFIVLAIPIVGIIMQFVWALSSDTQPSKRTFCQAGLILTAIVIVVAVVAVFALGGIAAIVNSQQHGT